jgi:hypothetical protein
MTGSRVFLERSAAGRPRLADHCRIDRAPETDILEFALDVIVPARVPRDIPNSGLAIAERLPAEGQDNFLFRGQHRRQGGGAERGEPQGPLNPLHGPDS